MAFFITINERGSEMENRLRGSYDKVFSAREGLPDEVKRLYGAIAWHLEGADVLSNLDIDLIEMTAIRN